MNEMVYTNKRYDIPQLLELNEYKGYVYIILSQGTHPTAYIKVDKDSVFYGRQYSLDDKKDCPINRIKCHGGVSYVAGDLGWQNNNGHECCFKEDYGVWFVGWDYANCDDYFPNREGLSLGMKKWTTEEIAEECKQVIDQMIMLEAEYKLKSKFYDWAWDVCDKSTYDCTKHSYVWCEKYNTSCKFDKERDCYKEFCEEEGIVDE